VRNTRRGNGRANKTDNFRQRTIILAEAGHTNLGRSILGMMIQPILDRANSSHVEGLCALEHPQLPNREYELARRSKTGSQPLEPAGIMPAGWTAPGKGSVSHPVQSRPQILSARENLAAEDRLNL